MCQVFLVRREGVVALITAIVVALFIFTAAALMATQGDVTIYSGQIQSQYGRAQYLAEAGIQDALLKVARIKSYSGSYTITETDGTVDVSVAVISSTTTLVNATSTVTWTDNTVKRSIKAQVTLDTDGKITSIAKNNQ